MIQEISINVYAKYEHSTFKAAVKFVMKKKNLIAGRPKAALLVCSSCFYVIFVALYVIGILMAMLTNRQMLTSILFF